MQELLRLARIYHTNLNGVSLDFQIGSRSLSFEGFGDAVQVYRSDGLAILGMPETCKTENLSGYFRWLAGLE